MSAEGLAQSPAVLREAIERAGIAGAPHGADAWQYRIGEAAIYIHPCHVDITQYPDLARVRGDLSLSEAIQYARELAPEYDAVTCVVSIDGVRWRVVYDDDPAAQAPDITHRWRCDGDGVVLELGTMAELPPQMTATSITLAHAKNGVSTIRVDGVVIDVCQEAGRSSPEAVRELAAWLAQALAERGQG